MHAKVITCWPHLLACIRSLQLRPHALKCTGSLWGQLPRRQLCLHHILQAEKRATLAYQRLLQLENRLRAQLCGSCAAMTFFVAEQDKS